METISLRVANWEGGEIDALCYSASLKAPCKLELLNLLPSHMDNLEYCVKFNTGILSSTAHSINVCIFRVHHEPKLGIFIAIEKQPDDKIVEVKMIDISYITSEQTSIQDSLSKSVPPKELQISPENLSNKPKGKEEFWLSTCGWHDDTIMLFLTFHVVSRYPPKIVNEDEDLFTPVRSTGGNINVSNYFMNEDCSDISIHCQSQKFPAHRLILSNRVRYFETMFCANMKENQDRVIIMNDLEPASCKELLRFIYQAKVECLPNFVRELFTTADKYGMDELKGLCERHLFNEVNVDNAVEIYDLSQMHNSPVLAKKAKEIILWNKDKFASDPETFKNFTVKYPDLVFQLFKQD